MIPEWDSLSSNTGGSLRLKLTVFFMFSVTFLVTFEVVSRHFRSRSAWSRIYRRASLPPFHTYFYVSFFLCFRLLQSRCLSCLRRVYSLPKTEGYIPPVHHSATIGLINDLWSLCCQGSEQVEVSFILEKMKGIQKFGLDLDIHRSLFLPPPPPGSDHRQNASEITAEEGLTDHERWRRVGNCSGASQPQLCAALLHWKVETKLLWTGYDLSPSSIIIPDFIC